MQFLPYLRCFFYGDHEILFSAVFILFLEFNWDVEASLYVVTRCQKLDYSKDAILINKNIIHSSSFFKSLFPIFGKNKYKFVNNYYTSDIYVFIAYLLRALSGFTELFFVEVTLYEGTCSMTL